MLIPIPNLLKEFFISVENQDLEIYNEFSLQHELGAFLRNKVPDIQVQFERNVSHFGFDKMQLEKKEIDIAIFSKSLEDLYCVLELKFPRNGQVPETMFSFCRDIMFLEQLYSAGFQSAYFVAVVDSYSFYSGKDQGIYGFFRSGRTINGTITKPTGAKDKIVHIKGSYNAKWLSVSDYMKYCVIEICI